MKLTRSRISRVIVWLFNHLPYRTERVSQYMEYYETGLAPAPGLLLDAWREDATNYYAWCQGARLRLGPLSLVARESGGEEPVYGHKVSLDVIFRGHKRNLFQRKTHVVWRW
jgi:hypothetical protein